MSKKTPLTRDEFGLFRSLQTRWSDNDIYGHLNNVVHYKLFDTAINGWLLDEGILTLDKPAFIGLVVETGCSYFSEIRFPDKVVAGIRVGRIGTSSVRYEIALFRNEDETASAQGYFIHVYVDPDNKKPQPLETAFKGRLEEFIR